jgi:hypothetical protein
MHTEDGRTIPAPARPAAIIAPPATQARRQKRDAVPGQNPPHVVIEKADELLKSTQNNQPIGRGADA